MKNEPLAIGGIQVYNQFFAILFLDGHLTYLYGYRHAVLFNADQAQSGHILLVTPLKTVNNRESCKSEMGGSAWLFKIGRWHLLVEKMDIPKAECAVLI